MIKTVAVAGKFDPVHDEHIDHIVKASKLGDFLYIITHTDEIIAKQKGYYNIPLWARRVLLSGIMRFYCIQGAVLISVDDDGTVAKTLKLIRPNIFAKGGDRTPDNMPLNEIETCEEIGCKIMYGVGNSLNSSSRMGNIKGG